VPAIRAIRRGDVFVHLVCRPGLGEILLSNNVADRVSSHDEGRLAALYGGSGETWLKEYDAAYVFGRAPETLHDTLRFHIPGVESVRSVPPEGSGIHCGLYQFRQVAEGPAQEARYELRAPEAAAEGGGGPTVCIHPGSGGVKKCWPPEGFADLIMGLAARGGYSFRILLGPAEEGGYDEWTRGRLGGLGSRVVTARGLPLHEVAGLLAAGSFYIGNDSGISHLAAALGLPGVVIFGPTDPCLWRPWGEGMRVVASDRECAPCGERYRECGDPSCLRHIAAGRVIEAFETLRVSAGCSSSAG